MPDFKAGQGKQNYWDEKADLLFFYCYVNEKADLLLPRLPLCDTRTLISLIEVPLWPWGMLWRGQRGTPNSAFPQNKLNAIRHNISGSLSSLVLCVLPAVTPCPLEVFANSSFHTASPTAHLRAAYVEGEETVPLQGWKTKPDGFCS